MPATALRSDVKPSRRRRSRDPEPGSIEELRSRLSFARGGLTPEEWDTPACYWDVGETAALERGRPRVTASYTLDCLLGRALATECIQVLRQYPQHQNVLGDIFRDMVKRGRVSGIEVAFINGVVGQLVLRTIPAVSIIKARVEQPDGSHGIYERE